MSSLAILVSQNNIELISSYVFSRYHYGMTLSPRGRESRSVSTAFCRAAGSACPTMEMFEAFGFSERVLRESYWVNETCFWKPDEARPESVVRSRVIQDVEDGVSEFPHVILNQARIH